MFWTTTKGEGPRPIPFGLSKRKTALLKGEKESKGWRLDIRKGGREEEKSKKKKIRRKQKKRRKKKKRVGGLFCFSCLA